MPRVSSIGEMLFQNLNVKFNMAVQIGTHAELGNSCSLELG